MKRINQPRLGDTEKSENLGHRSKHKMIYHACEKCGKKRWVRTDKDNRPASRHCHDCALEIAADAKAEFRRGANRESKISEVWGDNCYTCGRETNILHRKDCQPHDNIRRMSVKDFQKLYEDDKDKYVKLCNGHHQKVHDIADDGWCWDDLEDFIKEVYEGENWNEF
jgi:hypothetical protein